MQDVTPFKAKSSFLTSEAGFCPGHHLYLNLSSAASPTPRPGHRYQLNPQHTVVHRAGWEVVGNFNLECRDSPPGLLFLPLAQTQLCHSLENPEQESPLSPFPE